MKFEPDLPDFFEYMAALVDVVKNSVQVVPRVENKLYTERPWKVSDDKKQNDKELLIMLTTYVNYLC